VLDYKKYKRLRDIHDAFFQYFSKFFFNEDLTLLFLSNISDGLQSSNVEVGKLKYSENNRKPDPTNPTCNDMRSNPSLCGERPSTSRLRHGTGRHEIIAPYPNKWSLGTRFLWVAVATKCRTNSQCEDG
jgi:hypothetical protein